MIALFIVLGVLPSILTQGPVCNQTEFNECTGPHYSASCDPNNGTWDCDCQTTFFKCIKDQGGECWKLQAEECCGFQQKHASCDLDCGRHCVPASPPPPAAVCHIQNSNGQPTDLSHLTTTHWSNKDTQWTLSPCTLTAGGKCHNRAYWWAEGQTTNNPCQLYFDKLVMGYGGQGQPVTLVYTNNNNNTIIGNLTLLCDETASYYSIETFAGSVGLFSDPTVTVRRGSDHVLTYHVTAKSRIACKGAPPPPPSSTVPSTTTPSTPQVECSQTTFRNCVGKQYLQRCPQLEKQHKVDCGCKQTAMTCFQQQGGDCWSNAQTECCMLQALNTTCSLDCGNCTSDPPPPPPSPSDDICSRSTLDKCVGTEWLQRCPQLENNGTVDCNCLKTQMHCFKQQGAECWNTVQPDCCVFQHAKQHCSMGCGTCGPSPLAQPPSSAVAVPTAPTTSITSPSVPSGGELCDKAVFNACAGEQYQNRCPQEDNKNIVDCFCLSTHYKCLRQQGGQCWVDVQEACCLLQQLHPSCDIQCGSSCDPSSPPPPAPLPAPPAPTSPAPAVSNNPSSGSNGCEHLTCRNGGTCSQPAAGTNSTTPICVCAAGWSGEQCTDRMFDCNTSRDACMNGGTCTHQPDGNVCDCAAGYTDKRCESNIYGLCHPNPCQHGGNCTVHWAAPICECPDGYYGDICNLTSSASTCNVLQLQACTANKCTKIDASDFKGKCDYDNCEAQCCDGSNCVERLSVLCNSFFEKKCLPPLCSNNNTTECSTETYTACYKNVLKNRKYYITHCDYSSALVKCTIDAGCVNLQKSQCDNARPVCGHQLDKTQCPS